MGNSAQHDLRSRLDTIKSNLGSARLIAVTKTVGIEQIKALESLGQTVFGESRVQDAEQKISILPGEWHMIGHLQANKAKDAVRLFSWIDSIDSFRIAKKVSDAAASIRKEIQCLIQVNISGEPQKYGASPDQLQDLIKKIADLPAIKVRGLMAIAPHLPPEKTRPYFRQMKTLFDSQKKQYSFLEELSMGMTNDYKIAIEEGATMVRIGTALWR